MPRRDNGEGTLFQRKDGRWCARINVTLPNGEIKREGTIKKDRAAAKAQLDKWKDRNRKHLPFIAEKWTVESYANHWLEKIIINKVRLSTLIRYRETVSKLIIPYIGKVLLIELGVRHLQTVINDMRQRGVSSNAIIKFRNTLSGCLTCAMREEFIFRNVAQLVEIPQYTRKPITPWSVDQAKVFLRETKGHAYHIAYALMLTYGIRKGEMQGLRWSDIDFANNIIHIRQQVRRFAGAMRACDVKTQAGRRQLPLNPDIKQELFNKAREYGIEIPPFDPIGDLSMDKLILVSSKNAVVEPRNLDRSFHLYTEKLGFPRITLHTLRHTAATILKNMGVPVKDVQLILGHSDIATTLKIYQHGDKDAQAAALKAVGAVLNNN